MQERKAIRLRESLLVALCRRDVARHLDAIDVAPFGDERFRQGFLEFASAHRVLGLALSILTPALARRGQAAAASPFDSLLRNVRRRATVFEMKRDRVVAALLNRGVRPVILKGAALAITFYDESCQRDLADLDILVREDELDPSLQVLGEEGYSGPSSPEKYQAYRHQHFHIPVRYSDAHIVEIHWALTMPRAPFSLDASEILAGATPLERSGQPTLLLPRPEHMLLHLVIQNLQEGFSRLARLVDIDRIVASTPALDWEVLMAAARKGNLASPTTESLELAHRLLGTTIPDGVLRELRPGAVARFHLAILRPARSFLSQRFKSVHSAKYLHELWLVGGVRRRLLLLRQILTSDPAITFPRKKKPAVLLRLWRLVKLVLLQLILYLAAALDLVTPSGPEPMRAVEQGRSPGRSTTSP